MSKKWTVIGMEEGKKIGEVEAPDYDSALTLAIEEFTEKNKGVVADVEPVDKEVA